MEQRRLRLGDILDDYCPRERRVTNHAVVAMIEDDVKQTRCTTCDAEHAYKGGKAPRKRRKDTTAALYQEVLAGLPEGSELPVPRPSDPIAVSPEGSLAHEPEAVTVAAHEEPEDDFREPEPDDDSEPVVRDEGPVHRRLIRATLPRPEGQQPEARQLPDFTVRSNGNRPGGGFRGDRMRGQGNNGNGHGMRAGGRRFGNNGGQGGNRPGGGGRNRPGFGGGPPRGNQGRPQGGRKRSR